MINNKIFTFCKRNNIDIININTNDGYIEPIKLMLKKHYFSAFYIENESWYDIDTPDEYEIVKKYIKRRSDENL